MDLISLISLVFNDFQPGRLIEGLVYILFLWRKVRPHLDKIETRLEGLEEAVKTGFNSGELRFLTIEDRIVKLETQKGSITS